jgi:hypothetical protein
VVSLVWHCASVIFAIQSASILPDKPKLRCFCHDGRMEGHLEDDAPFSIISLAVIGRTSQSRDSEPGRLHKRLPT